MVTRNEVWLHERLRSPRLCQEMTVEAVLLVVVVVVIVVVVVDEVCLHETKFGYTKRSLVTRNEVWLHEM